MIKVQDSVGNEVPLKVLTFAGGEQHVQLPERRVFGPGVFHLTAHLHNAADIMTLLLVTDAIRRKYGADVPITLLCPYLPYARQDRVCADGEALSVAVMCNLLNAQNYELIALWDTHSDVAPALLNSVLVVPQRELVLRYIEHLPMPKVAVVAPDAGAAKKAFDLARYLKVPFIQGLKHRNVTTGVISGTTIEPTPVPDQTALLVVDDICDGGRTFIELSKVLADSHLRCTQHLYVTHGIFSRGLEPLLKHYKTVLCPNVWPGIPENPRLIRLS